MHLSQGWHNSALLLLLVNICIYSSSGLLFIYLILTLQREPSFLVAIYSAAGNFCHWIITTTYIQVSFETKQLLNKDTYIKASTELVSVEKFRCCLITANVVISLLILLIAITIYFAYYLGSAMLYAVGADAIIVFQLGSMLAWAWTLIKLYRDINHSE